MSILSDELTSFTRIGLSTVRSIPPNCSFSNQYEIQNSMKLFETNRGGLKGVQKSIHIS